MTHLACSDRIPILIDMLSIQLTLPLHQSSSTRYSVMRPWLSVLPSSSSRNRESVAGVMLWTSALLSFALSYETRYALKHLSPIHVLGIHFPQARLLPIHGRSHADRCGRKAALECQGQPLGGDGLGKREDDVCW